MKSEFDLDRLAEIPDPFPGAASPPQEPRNQMRAVYSPTRSRVLGTRVGAVAAAILYDAAWPAFVRRRGDMGAIRPAQLALELGVPLLAATIAAGVFGRTGRSMLGDRRSILALVVGSPVVFAMATAATLPHFDVDRFWIHTVGCMLVTSILAAGPLVLGMFAYRRAFATLSAWRAAGLGVASGALAAATMALACPIIDASHVLIGHGAVMLIAGALGGLLGRRICCA